LVLNPLISAFVSCSLFLIEIKNKKHLIWQRARSVCCGKFREYIREKSIIVYLFLCISDESDLFPAERDAQIDNETTSFIYNSNNSLSLAAQRERLPIRRYKNDILYCLEKYQTLILVGMMTNKLKHIIITHYIITLTLILINFR
jgi:ATP-dependent RNA helicase DDX35